VDPFFSRIFHLPICYKRLKSWLWIPSLENIFPFSFFKSVAKGWKVDCGILLSKTFFLFRVCKKYYRSFFFSRIFHSPICNKRLKSWLWIPLLENLFLFPFFGSVAKGWKVGFGILLSKNLFLFRICKKYYRSFFSREYFIHRSVTKRR
jgi:hypothetical protein